MISNAFYAFIFFSSTFLFFHMRKNWKFTKNRYENFPQNSEPADWHTHTSHGFRLSKLPNWMFRNWIKITKLLEQNRIENRNVSNRKSKTRYIVPFKGGWSWAWNHGGAWPSRWAPWQQPQSGPPSTGRGSSSNRGAGPSWANASSQRSWHPRQAANKYNSRWDTNKPKPISTKEIFSLS